MRKKLLNRAVIDALESRRLLSVSLVKDINTDTAPAQNAYGNQQITESGGNIYFRADDGVHGPELWVMPDNAGTPGTPTMVKDIDPGTFSSQSPSPYNDGYDVGPTRMTDVNGTLYFSEQYATNSFGLWKTNGTAAGTVLVYDANAGHESSGPDHLTNVNGTLYFTAYDSSNTQNLYKADGTTTTLVAQFNNGGGQSNYTPAGVFTGVGNNLIFGMYDQDLGSYAYQTWTSDGTTTGTHPLQTSGGVIYSQPETPAITLNGNTYIGTTGGLFETDGTSANTTQIYTGDIEAMVNDNGTLYFAGHDSSFNLDLFKSDGTNTGTSVVAQLMSSSISASAANNFAVVNGLVLFETGAPSATGALWRSDGTQAGTYTLSTVVAPVTEHPNELVVSGNTAYFIQHGGNSNNDELWSTQGVAGDPAVVKVIASGLGGLRNEANAGGVTTQDLFVGSSGRIYFSADDGTHGLELWSSDGTAVGTAIVDDINTSTASSGPGDLTDFNGLTFFAATDNSGYSALFSTDGTAAGTKSVFSTGTDFGIYSLTVSDGLLYFIAGSGGLYSTNGSTVSAITTSGAGGISGAEGLTNVNGALYFVAYHNAGPGVYVIPSAGAVPVQLVSVSSSNAQAVSSFVQLGSRVLFQFQSQIGQTTLYTTDGTPGNTLPVTTLASTQSMYVLNGYAYFEGSDPINGTTLWRSDGTSAGTGMFANVSIAGASGPYGSLALAGSELYFISVHTGGPNQLWKTDGTAAGTVAVTPLVSGEYITGLLPFGNDILFSASTGSTGYHPWISDGTSAVQLSTVASGNFNSTDAIVDGSEAYFSAYAATNTTQLWATDGTVSGTQEVAIVNPTGNANPSNFAIGSNGSVLFAATTTAYGIELWSYTPSAPGTVSGTVTIGGQGLSDQEVYLDVNNNGVLDPGEPSTQASGTGAYTFYNVIPGSYTIRQTSLPSGYTQVTPADNAGIPITVVSGAALTGENFTDAAPVVPGSISGSVSTDGTLNTGLAGVSVYLDVSGSTGPAAFSTTTTTNGSFAFSNVPSGSYILRQTVPAGYDQAVPANGAGLPITIGNGTIATGENFVDAKPLTPGSISGFVSYTSNPIAGATIFLDANNNGLLDAGELSTTTSSAGAYSFSNVPTGTYTIRQIAPSGYSQTSPANSAGIAVTLTSGEVLSNENFADQPPVVLGTVSGSVTAGGAGVSGATVFLDANNNGALDAGEISTTTSSSGAFSFSNVSLGSYVVDQIPPAGYTQTSPSNNAGFDITILSGYAFSAENFTDTPVATVKQLTGTTIGTAGSYKNDGNTIAKATDGNLSTYFDGPSANGNWVGLDLGAAGGVVTQIKFASRSGWASRMNGGIFQASNSTSFSSGVVNLYTIPSNANPSSTTLTTVNLSNKTAYRYYRYLSPNGSYGDVSEVQFFGNAGGLVVHTRLTGTTIGTSGSYKNDGNTIAKATDGNLSTFFDGANSNGNWVGLDLGSSKSISQIAFAPRSGYASRMVGGQIQISTSANFTTGVTTIYTITAAPATGSLTTITLAKAVTARYVRYLSPNGSYGDIAEFQVFS